jgi:indolepyruvate ferredoxin oxidoreductase, alpha subunit
LDYIQAHELNEFFDGRPVGRWDHPARMYSGVMRALMPSGLADIRGATRVPLYVLNVTYPRLNSEIIRFCSGTLSEAGILARLLGKRVLPMAGEYNVGAGEEGVRGFMSPAGLAGELTPPANAGGDRARSICHSH